MPSEVKRHAEIKEDNEERLAEFRARQLLEQLAESAPNAKSIKIDPAREKLDWMSTEVSDQFTFPLKNSDTFERLKRFFLVSKRKPLIENQEIKLADQDKE